MRRGLKSIDRRKAKDFTLQEFRSNYLARNEPVIIIDALDDSSYFQCWQKTDKSFNLELLLSICGDKKVPLINCRRQTSYESINSSATVTVAEFFDMQQSNPEAFSHMYLKDWHFQQNCNIFSVDDETFTVPIYFCDDWLNAWSDTFTSSDYRFVYIGGKNTFTPLHHDVLCSFSWSMNIVGRKRWILFPPEETQKLMSSTGEVAHDCREGKYDKSSFPFLSTAQCVEVFQYPNEAIFVPSAWYHQVHNECDEPEGCTVSVNHNWINAHNLSYVFAFLREELLLVRTEIECERAAMGDADWLNHCSLIMRANCGMDFDAFIRMLSCGEDSMKRRGESEEDRKHAAETVAAIANKMIHCQDPPILSHMSGESLSLISKYKNE